MEHFVTFDNVCKYYQMGENRIAAADHVTFHIEKRRILHYRRPFGRGKTTVLNMLGGMDTCDEGHIWLDGKEVRRLQSAAAHRIPPVRRGLCIPVLQSGAEPDGAGKRGARQRDLQKAAACRPKRCARWGWSTAWATSRRSFRAASSSAFPLPARWPKTQNSSV